MSPVKYKIAYLPIASSDILDIVVYITEELAAPEAASRLLDEIDRAIAGLKTFPYAHALYPTDADTKPFEIRALFVKSYIVLYYIVGDIVTVARVVYGGRDIQSILQTL